MKQTIQDSFLRIDQLYHELLEDIKQHTNWTETEIIMKFTKPDTFINKLKQIKEIIDSIQSVCINK